MNEKYISMKDAAEKLGVKRPSLYHYIEVLHIEKHKFDLDRQSYMTVTDFERIRTLKDGAAQRAASSLEVM